MGNDPFCVQGSLPAVHGGPCSSGDLDLLHARLSIEFGLYNSLLFSISSIKIFVACYIIKKLTFFQIFSPTHSSKSEFIEKIKY